MALAQGSNPVTPAHVCTVSNHWTKLDSLHVAPTSMFSAICSSSPHNLLSGSPPRVKNDKGCMQRCGRCRGSSSIPERQQPDGWASWRVRVGGQRWRAHVGRRIAS